MPVCLLPLPPRVRVWWGNFGADPLLIFNPSFFANSHRGLLHGWHVGGAERVQAGAEFGDRVCDFAGCDRGCGHRAPEGDGGEYSVGCMSLPFPFPFPSPLISFLSLLLSSRPLAKPV